MKTKGGYPGSAPKKLPPRPKGPGASVNPSAQAAASVSPQATLHVVPLELEMANDCVRAWHRHHPPATGHRFSLGVADENGVIRGVAIMGRPVGRGFDQRRALEVTRCATDGTPNACSMLYGAAARSAKAQGYAVIRTYILDTESGVSLKAAGWVLEEAIRGRDWVRTDGAPRANTNTQGKYRWARYLNELGPVLVFPDVPTDQGVLL